MSEVETVPIAVPDPNAGTPTTKDHIDARAVSGRPRKELLEVRILRSTFCVQ